MAITIIQSPEKYTPAGNPIIWQVESDAANLVYFKVEVFDYDTNVLLGNRRISPTPSLLNGSYTDLSGILENVVKYEVMSNLYIVGLLYDPIRSYKVKFTEYHLSSGAVTEGASLTTSAYYVWDAKLDKLSFQLYTDEQYVVNSVSGISFLTRKPGVTRVNAYTTETVQLIQEPSILSGGSQNRVHYAVYDAAGAFIRYDEHFMLTAPMTRLNVSPDALSATFGYVFTPGMSYTIQVLSVDSQPRSVIRTYKYDNAECHLSLMNVLWVNSLGGVDSYQFVNPQESSSVNRTSVKRNPYRIDGGLIKNIHDNVFNSEDEVISSTPSNSVKAWTKVLSDDEVMWLGEMLHSRQIWVELANGMLVPVNLKENSYNYQRQKYLQGQLNQMQFEFAFPDWYVPALSNNQASYIINS